MMMMNILSKTYPESKSNYYLSHLFSFSKTLVLFINNVFSNSRWAERCIVNLKKHMRKKLFEEIDLYFRVVLK